MSEYAERLMSELEDKYDFSNSAWVTFLKDHRNYILASANVLNIDVKIVNSFRYYISGLLIENKINPDSYWIIEWLNQIKGEWEVIDFDKLIVPSGNTIDTLWDKFLAYNNKIQSS